MLYGRCTDEQKKRDVNSLDQREIRWMSLDFQEKKLEEDEESEIGMPYANTLLIFVKSAS